jgi:hypothetical protein
MQVLVVFLVIVSLITAQIWEGTFLNNRICDRNCVVFTKNIVISRPSLEELSISSTIGQRCSAEAVFSGLTVSYPNSYKMNVNTGLGIFTFTLSEDSNKLTIMDLPMCTIEIWRNPVRLNNITVR